MAVKPILFRTSAVLAAISNKRFHLEDEKEAQKEMFEALVAKFGDETRREVPISGGFIDFMVDRIGVEVKLKGAAGTIFRQVALYAADPDIDAIILATSKAMSLPSTICEKPCCVLNLGSAWL